MRDVRELYPGLDERTEWDDPDEDVFQGTGDHEPIIAEIGTVVVRVDYGTWQGDFYLLYRDGSRYGFLRLGYGSCSACDALQGCESYREIQEYADGVELSVNWFESASEALHWFESHDWDGDYDSERDEAATFVSEVKRYLKEAVRADS